MSRYCSRVDAVAVIGSADRHYTVRFPSSGPSCTCPGYHYRSACKHLDQARVTRCTWHSGGEPESIPGSCPLCGAAIVTATPIIEKPLRGGPIITVSVSISEGDAFTVGSLVYNVPAYAYRVQRSTDDPIVCLSLAAPTAIKITPLTLLDLPAHDGGTCTSCSARLVPTEYAYAARLLQSILQISCKRLRNAVSPGS